MAGTRADITEDKGCIAGCTDPENTEGTAEPAARAADELIGAAGANPSTEHATRHVYSRPVALPLSYPVTDVEPRLVDQPEVHLMPIERSGYSKPNQANTPVAMHHTTRRIARGLATAALAASMLFPGRVQKPLHEELRQGVAVADVQDVKGPTFEEIVNIIKGFKTAQEAMNLVNNPNKYGLTEIKEPEGPARWITEKEISEYIKHKDDPYKVIEKFGFQLPLPLAQTLFGNFLKLEINEDKILFSGRTGFEPSEYGIHGMEAYIVPVAPGYTLLYLLNHGAILTVKGKEYFNNDFSFEAIIFSKDGSKSELNGLNFKKGRFRVTFSDPETFKNTGRLGTVFGVIKDNDGKYIVLNQQLCFSKDYSSTFKLDELITNPKEFEKNSTGQNININTI